MSKLSHKPNHVVKKLTWENLDNILLSNFSESTTDKPSAVIQLSDFEMSKAEIIEEATAQGYQVIDNSDGYLKFLQRILKMIYLYDLHQYLFLTQQSVYQIAFFFSRYTDIVLVSFPHPLSNVV